MPLDVFPDNGSFRDFANSRPGFAPGLDATFGEDFAAAWSSASGTIRDWRVGQAQFDHVQSWIGDFEKTAGYAVANPEYSAGGEARGAGYAALQKAYDAEKLKHPDFALPPPPTEATARAAAIEAERQRNGDAAGVLARPQAPYAWWGSFFGGAAAAIADPINLASMALSGGSGGIVMSALRMAAITGGSQAAISAASYGVNKEIDPNYGLGDVAGEIAMAAGGGAVLGGGARALAKAWAAFKAPAANIDAVRENWAGGIRVSDRGKTVRVSTADLGVGELLASVHPDAVTVNLVSVDDMHQGRGVAVALYERAVAFARSRDLPFRSDQSVTAAAARIYDGLRRRGYKVTTSATAVRNRNGSYTGGRDGYVFEVSDPRPAPAAEVLASPVEAPPAVAAETAPAQAELFIPRHVEDAANVVSREAAITEASPFKTAGINGEAAHARNYKAAEKAVVEGRPPEIPPDQFAAQAWRPARVFDASGREIGVKYEVVDSASLVSSHTDELGINPDYPAELQPRQRDRAVSQAQIADMAAKLEPARLGPSADASTGAPIVGPDNVVESGNGRVLAIRRAFGADGEPAAAYRQYLEQQGFDTSGMKAPVLIARRVTDLAPGERVQFTDAANRANILRLSAPEQAMADARLLDSGHLAKIDPLAALTSPQNRPFVRAFISELPQGERGGLVDRHGVLSAEGQRRVEAAVLARAYGDPAVLSRVLESPDSGVKALGGALTDSAGRWAAMRDAVSHGTIPAGMDISNDLLDAFRLVAKSRDERIPLLALVDQAEMFSAPSPVTRALLRLMFRNEEMTQAASRQAVARGLAGYAEEALKNTTDARLFGDPLSTQDVLATALQKAGREDLFSAAHEATAPEAAIKKMADPAVADASLHQLEHLQEASPDLMVPDRSGLLDAEGNPIMRPIKEMLAEADGEIKAADEIAACAVGATPAAAAA